MVLADMGTTVLPTLQKAAWYIAAGSTAIPSHVASLYGRGRRKLAREGKKLGPKGIISFKYMDTLTDDDK
jgi:hypothetical protein